MGIPFDTVVHIGDISFFSSLIEMMSREFYSDNLYHLYTSGLYLKIFFIKLGELLQSRKGNCVSPHFERMSLIRSKIYSTPQHEWSIEKLADEMNMSVSYFEHTYKSTFGTSVMNDVINSRIDYAKFMLSTTDIPVGHIAEMCGYKSNVHFLQQLKKRTDITPSQYRESFKKNNDEIE